MDKSVEPETYFATAQREVPARIATQNRKFHDPALSILLRAVSDSVFVLNGKRQVVFANENGQSMVEVENIDEILGKRPGEIMGCENAYLTEGGCGTSRKCRTCGAVLAVLDGLNGKEGKDECRITRKTGNVVEAFDFKVCATPWIVEDELFVVFAMQDVSHMKRRRALERVFFHDILNTAGSAAPLMDILADESSGSMRSTLHVVRDSFTMMTEEIKAQRILLEAENNELQIKVHPLTTAQVLDKTKTICALHKSATNKNIYVADCFEDVTFSADFTLLRRVLMNLVKNGLEAITHGESVTLNCKTDGPSVVFSVNNPGQMPEKVQDNIFRRSFSTKGSGRGLGTYSTRLLVERYLGGAVWFEISEQSGVTFFVRLPLAPMQ